MVIQEDPGGNAHVSRVVAYDIATGDRGVELHVGSWRAVYGD